MREGNFEGEEKRGEEKRRILTVLEPRGIYDHVIISLDRDNEEYRIISYYVYHT